MLIEVEKRSRPSRWFGLTLLSVAILSWFGAFGAWIWYFALDEIQNMFSVEQVQLLMSGFAVPAFFILIYNSWLQSAHIRLAVDGIQSADAQFERRIEIEQKRVKLERDRLNAEIDRVSSDATSNAKALNDLLKQQNKHQILMLNAQRENNKVVRERLDFDQRENLQDIYERKVQKISDRCRDFALRVLGYTNRFSLDHAVSKYTLHILGPPDQLIGQIGVGASVFMDTVRNNVISAIDELTHTRAGQFKDSRIPAIIRDIEHLIEDIDDILERLDALSQDTIMEDLQIAVPYLATNLSDIRRRYDWAHTRTRFDQLTRALALHLVAETSNYPEPESVGS